MYQDSGCNRCVAGHDVHDTWHRYLDKQGLTPVRLNKKEEFIFGNCKVEISDYAFQYPVFFGGTLVGSIDVARIPVACPALFSKRMMVEWKHVLDFAKQTTYIGAFDLQYPFENSIPVLDIFQLPSSLAMEKIPPCFRASSRHQVHQVETAPEPAPMVIASSGSSSSRPLDPRGLWDPLGHWGRDPNTGHWPRPPGAVTPEEQVAFTRYMDEQLYGPGATKRTAKGILVFLKRPPRSRSPRE